MNKFLFFVLTVFLSFNSFGQNKYVKGYFIDTKGIRKDCYIKNKDWKNTPTSFKYKFSLDEAVLTNDLTKVSEFSILNKVIYKSFLVDMERSNTKIGFLDKEIDPNYQEEKVFMKVLVEGEANLYYYKKGNLQKFFYQIKDSKVKLLVYKVVIRYNNLVENREFKKQLWRSVRCDKTSYEQLRNLKYRKDFLIQYFEDYNECIQSN